MTGHDIEDLFAAARAEVVQPSPGLMVRILADAAAEQPRPVPPRPAPPARFGLWSMISALGGRGALAGLATAMIAGLWIGLAPPAAVDDLAATIWVADGGDSVELIPDLEGMISDADG